MQRKTSLTREIKHLDMMINALESELAEQTASIAKTDESLNREIVEALDELRLARGVRKMFLSAFAESAPAQGKRVGTRISRRSSFNLSPAA